jgi:hypothetical protein
MERPLKVGAVEAAPKVTLTSLIPICLRLPDPGDPAVLPSELQLIWKEAPLAMERPVSEAVLAVLSPSAVL